MSETDALGELNERQEMARRMGGPEGIARQRSRGKLTVRERLDVFADPDSLREFGMLGGAGTYADGELVAFTPKGHVDAMCRLDGRKVVVTAGDFTVRGGSAGGSEGGLGQELRANERAREWLVPYIRLLDAAGGSVRSFEDLGRTYLPDGNSFTAVETDLLNLVPVVSAVMGSVAGLPAVNACMAHWNVMVRETGQVFPGGPPVVKAALGYDITKEDLGGAHIHAKVSGVIDNLASSDEDALHQIRRFLSYLPTNVYKMAPRSEPAEPAGPAEELRDIIPTNRRKAFNSHRIIELAVDEGSFFEIAPDYGKPRITGLARVDGYPVAVMANNPRAGGGSTTVAAGDKVIRLMQLCDLFHLPLISFADEPGFMVGLESEKQGIERAGARMVWATCQSRMPMLTFVIGRLYGVAGQCHHRPSGMFRRYAWPTARWGSMHISGGAAAAYRREISEADDPVAKLAEFEARLQALASPFRTAEATGQDIIDPAETRALLVEFVHDAQDILALQLGPPPIPYRP
ncbi:MAG: Propionyl-CoA carboxylase [Ilumatobacteraceae bacterium]|nr:Propionyl-CoA carboxylase [Ilumatobacteraceae bacterium]